MPDDRPRYLMGVGRPEDLLAGIAAGIDMFDCVMPTRNARNGQLFVRAGRINIANSVHRDAERPVRGGLPCETCRGYSRAYLAHLFHAKEILYRRLATMHNLQHYLDLVRGAREAILAGRLAAYVSQRPRRPWPSGLPRRWNGRSPGAPAEPPWRPAAPSGSQEGWPSAWSCSCPGAALATAAISTRRC